VLAALQSIGWPDVLLRIFDAIEQVGGRVVSLDVTQEGERRSVAADVELPPRTTAVAVVASVADIDGVLEVQWTD